MNNEEKNLKNQESVTTDGTEKVTIITGNTDVSEDWSNDDIRKDESKNKVKGIRFGRKNKQKEENEKIQEEKPVKKVNHVGLKIVNYHG